MSAGSSSLLRFLRFIHDRNPFYLLSALCMFVGFRVVLGALNSAPADWKTLLLLIGTLHVYEAVIIGLALFLILKRGLLRDGWILLGIEALFLVDLTNLNAELFTALPRLGAVVNAACFVLALVKIGVVVRTLKLRLTPGTAFYIAAQLAFLLGLPGLFYLIRSPAAAVSSMQIYGVWWMVAIMIAGGFLLVKPVQSDDSPMTALPWRLYIFVPLISLLVHLVGENRVYWIHFHPANLSPLLVVAALAITRSRFRWHALAVPGTMAMLAIAAALSVVPHEYQRELSTHLLHVSITPLRLAMLASMALSIYVAVRRYSWMGAYLAAAYAVLLWLGGSPGQMLSNGLRFARSTMELAMDLIPDTALQWGCSAIVASFVLLGVGAMFSLKKSGGSTVLQS
jgi:hypothetical protein